MAKIIMTKPSQSGIALGGIDAGSVELMPDGEFHYWQIANPPRLTRVCWEEKADDGESHTGALSFRVRTNIAAIFGFYMDFGIENPENVTLPLCLPGVLGTVRVENGSASVRVAGGGLEGWIVLVGQESAIRKRSRPCRCLPDG